MDFPPDTADKMIIAWNIVKEQLINRAEATAKAEGEGINIFQFLAKPSDNGSNLKHMYATRERGIWDKIVENYTHRDKLKELYDPEKNFGVCVYIPIVEDGEDTGKTIGNIKLFEFDTRTEVEIEEE